LLKRTFRGVIHALGGLGAGLAIVVVLAAWQLSKGPISLGYLSPYIEEAVNSAQQTFRLRLKDTILTWAGWDRTLDIRIIDAQILSRENVQIGRIPEVSLSLSGKALLGGRIAPRTIEIFGPELTFRRTVKGDISIVPDNAGGLGNAPAIGLIKEFLEGPGPDSPLRYLDRIDIASADVRMDDQALAKTWHAPATDIHLYRDSQGVAGRVSLILDLDGKQTEIEITGRYRAVAKVFELTADLDKLSLVPFAPVFRDLAPLRGFRLPLHGSVAISIPMDGSPESVRFDLTGGKGELNLPAPFGKSVLVNKVVFKGSYTGHTQVTEISELRVSLDAGQTISLPPPIDHGLPIRNFTMSGRFDGEAGKLTVNDFRGDLDGPKVAFRGVASGIGKGGDVRVDLAGDLNNVPVDDMVRYWPKSLGSDAHSWATTHLDGGTVTAAHTVAEFAVTERGDIRFDKISGDMNVVQVDVNYLPPMPKVRVDDVKITFNENTMNFSLSGGRSQGLVLSKGKVVLTGLDKVDQYANVRLTIDGSLKSKLEYIEQKPLQLASKISFDPATARGQAQTDLQLDFILEKKLTMDQVRVSAHSKLSDVRLSNVFLGRDIQDSTLDLKVDNVGMTVTGEVKIDDIPAQLVWRDNFSTGQAYRSRYDLSAVIRDVRRLANLGVDMEPFPDDYIGGELGVSIRYTVFDEIDRRLEVSADITESHLAVPQLGWLKKAGVPGRAEIALDMERDVVVDVPNFSIKAADLLVRGAIKYAPDGTGLERVEFRRLSYGRTDLEGALIPKGNGGWDAGFHGKSFDLSPIWKDLTGADVSRFGKRSILPDLTLAVEIDQVWLTDADYLKSISGTFDFADKMWRTVMVSSTIGEQTTFDLNISPRPNGNRQLSLRSSDAGEAFRFLKFYDNMRGGQLNVTGGYDDSVPDSPLSGRIAVKDFRIVNAPTLTKMISILSLTGILEALGGKGLAFNTLDAPFVLKDGTFMFTDARASGVSLGFTASGNVYTHAGVLDLQGTVIPAYALNSAFGKIPLLGDLLTGGEKGGGVFAANYSMSGSLDKPDIQVNPLSALTPGILRKVFGIFDAPENQDKALQNTPENQNTQ